MLKHLIHHVGIHAAQHPEETLGAVFTVGKALIPFVPYVAGGVVAATCVAYVADKITNK